MTTPQGPYGDQLSSPYPENNFSQGAESNFGQRPDQQPYAPPPMPSYPPQGYGYPPPGYSNFNKPIGWFVVNWLFFWPLAIYSLVSPWNQMTEALARNDLQNAEKEANRVRNFGKIALAIWAGLMLFWFIAVGCAVSTLPY